MLTEDYFIESGAVESRKLNSNKYHNATIQLGDFITLVRSLQPLSFHISVYGDSDFVCLKYCLIYEYANILAVFFLFSNDT